MEQKNNKLLILIYLLTIIFISPVLISATLESEAIVYYKFDTNNVTQVSSVDNSFNGTVNGATFDTSGFINNSYNYDGTNDDINIKADNTGWFNGVQDHSISLWFKADTVNSLRHIYTDRGKIGNVFIRLNAGSLFEVGIYDGSDTVTFSESFSDTTSWHHVVVAIDFGNEYTVYLDGVNKTPLTIGTPDTLTSPGTLFGSNVLNSRYFDGKIDEVGIFNSILTPSQVSDLYNSGVGLQYPFSNDTTTSITIDNITANGELFIDNTTFTTNDIEFITSYTVNDTYINFTNTSTIQITNATNGNYFIQFNITYNGTSVLSDNYSYVINVTSGINFVNISFNDIELNNNSYWNTSTLNASLQLENVSTSGDILSVFSLFIYPYTTGTEINFPDATPGLNVSWLLNDPTNLIDGLYKIYFYSTNYIVNKKSDIFYFTLDTTEPIINNNMPTQILNYNLTNITINATDDNLLSCYILIDSINTSCSSFSAQNFTTNGNKNWIITAIDLSGNIATETGTLLVNPIQYFRFYDTENSIYVSNFTFGTYQSNNSYVQIPLYDLGLGLQNLQFQSLGYSNENFSFTFNTTSLLNTTFNVGTVKINVYIYYRINNTLFDKLTNVLILDLVNGSTTNGIITFENSSFGKGTYTIQASSLGYYTEQKVFTYTGENTIDVSLYLLNETGISSSTLKVNVQNELYNKIPNANTKLLEYDNNILGFREVGQCYTNSLGQCSFLIELGVKTYIITSSIVIDGVTYQAISSPDGEIFQPEIIDGEAVSTGIIERDLTLKIIALYSINYLNGLSINAPETTEDTIEFENDSIKIINIPVNWTSTNNLDYTICLNYYWLNQGNKINFTQSNCSTSSAGSIGGYNITLDNSFNYQVDLTIYYDGETTLHKSYIYMGENSLNSILKDLAIVSPIILIAWVLLLSLALWSKKIIIFAIGSFFLSSITMIMFTNYLVGTGLVLIYLISIGIIYMARVERDIN